MLAEPIVRILFERGSFTAQDTGRAATALMAFAVGLPAFVLVKAFLPAFYAREDTRTPLLAALLAIALNVALNIAFLLGTRLEHASEVARRQLRVCGSEERTLFSGAVRPKSSSATQLGGGARRAPCIARFRFDASPRLLGACASRSTDVARHGRSSSFWDF